MRRIGIFGGSFDPVHVGHVALARTALAAVALDQVRWVPAGQPWQKARTLAAPEHRVAMVELAIAGEPRFLLDTVELRRTGPSYMLDTVRELQDAGAVMQPDWFLLIGQDQYARLSTWHGWRELVRRVTLAVAARDGLPVEPDPALAGVAHRCFVIPMPATPVSSTQVRARAAAGEALAGLVPPAVETYIRTHGLYPPASRMPEADTRTPPETPR